MKSQISLTSGAASTQISAITIDPEFEKLIRPLAPEERAELKESLASCGLLSPIIVWKHEGKTILVDGHNRLSLWKEYKGFNEEWEFKTQELRFGNRDKVKEWIIKNQLGRRNLSPDDYKILVGMLYNSRKKAKNDGGKGTSKGTVDQNDPQSTAAQVAAETGVSPATVKRAGKLAAAVEAIQAASPETPREEAIDKAKEQAKPAIKQAEATVIGGDVDTLDFSGGLASLSVSAIRKNTSPSDVQARLNELAVFVFLESCNLRLDQFEAFQKPMEDSLAKARAQVSSAKETGQ